MQWYLNDLSIQSQYNTPGDCVAAVVELARIRFSTPVLRDSLFCSKYFVLRPAVGERTLGEVVAAHCPKDMRRPVLAWLTLAGPFLEDDRWPEQDDYFEFEGHDVTLQGLGEAARRCRSGQAAGVFSFPGGTIDFTRDPLVVQHGLTEQPLGFVGVENVWSAPELVRRCIAAVRDPTSWSEMIELARSQFAGLLLSDRTLEQLQPSPFNHTVSNRILHLLSVLNEYIGARNADGTERQAAKDIRDQHFIGEKAWFTDESERNKIDFRQELTFEDPAGSGEQIFCPWHGKIRTQQFRIHFEWPIPVGQLVLKIAYIGPKITKR